MLAILPALVIATAPQGVSVQVQQLGVEGVTPADAQLVMKACVKELTAEGYPVFKPDDAKAKPMALVSGVVKKKGDDYLVTLTLTRASDQLILDESKVQVPHTKLEQAGVDAAKQLASQIRMTWGVRATIKLKP